MPRNVADIKMRLQKKRDEKNKAATITVHDPVEQLALAMKYLFSEEKDEKKAVELLKSAVKQDCFPAQFQLGCCYYEGIGVERDYTEANRLFTLAARQNFSPAQFYLGLSNYKAIGLKQNYSKAFELFRLSSNQDYIPAKCYLGLCYYEGHGVKKNYSEAFNLFSMAAKENMVPAKFYLGRCYDQGHGVEQNFSTAADLYAFAAAHNNIEAQFHLGCYYLKGIGVEQNFKKAAELFAAAAKSGDCKAQFYLAGCYTDGTGVEQNDKKATEFLMSAAEQNYPPAQYRLAFCYLEGKNLEQNTAEAMRLFKLSAEQGYPAAQNQLGAYYAEGTYVELNPAKAISLFTLAAEQGQKSAQYNLALSYFKGEVVPKNIAKAIELYTPLAIAGDANAQYDLASCYTTQKMTEQNIEKIFYFLDLAAKQGHARAEVGLGIFYLLHKRSLLKSFEEKNALSEMEDLRVNPSSIEPSTISPAEPNQIDDQAGLASFQQIPDDKASQEAVRLFESAAEKGNSQANLQLGMMYLLGHGIEKNSVLAADCFESLIIFDGDTSRQEQTTLCQFLLGICHFYGQGETYRQNLEKAVSLFETAQADCPFAQFYLSLCYLHGWGTQKNFHEAETLLNPLLIRNYVDNDNKKHMVQLIKNYLRPFYQEVNDNKPMLNQVLKKIVDQEIKSPNSTMPAIGMMQNYFYYLNKMIIANPNVKQAFKNKADSKKNTQASKKLMSQGFFTDRSGSKSNKLFKLPKELCIKINNANPCLYFYLPPELDLQEDGIQHIKKIIAEKGIKKSGVGECIKHLKGNITLSKLELNINGDIHEACLAYEVKFKPMTDGNLDKGKNRLFCVMINNFIIAVCLGRALHRNCDSDNLIQSLTKRKIYINSTATPHICY